MPGHVVEALPEICGERRTCVARVRTKSTVAALVTGTWREPQNSEAWPPAWWGCGVPYASYTWEIPGVYSFEVSAQDGFWTLDVSSEGVGTQAVSWTHDGCA